MKCNCVEKIVDEKKSWMVHLPLNRPVKSFQRGKQIFANVRKKKKGKKYSGLSSDCEIQEEDRKKDGCKGGGGGGQSENVG